MKPISPIEFTEADLLPISALQHLMFCERQCALLYLEQTWDENRLTVEGKILHEKVHNGQNESRGDARIARGLRLRSLKLGLTGQADVVEFRRQADGTWLPFPVEYKRGRPKPDICDEVQLCAQAMSLEEMLSVTIPEGAIFYGQPRRRYAVAFNTLLRAQTESAAKRLHQLFNARQTPPAIYDKKCDNCSLIHLCLPKSAGRNKSATRYLGAMLSE